MLANIRHIMPVTTIRRERMLPVNGKVLVRKGQIVAAGDVIAETTLGNEHALLDICRGLGVDMELADRQILVKAGQKVIRGDILAGPVGLARRVVRAPTDGIVLLAGEGQVLIELPQAPFQIKAGIPGVVVDLLPDRGAIIRNTGALIQGVWGNGQLDSGLLFALAKEPEHVLTADQVDVSLRGSIVLAGHCKDANVLNLVAEISLKGLVLGSLTPELAGKAMGLSLPVMLLEGFGNIPLDPVAFKLLTTNVNRDATLNAQPWDIYNNIRPELIIPLPVDQEPPMPKDGSLFVPGQRVRIVSATNFGRVGELVELVGNIATGVGIVAPSGEVEFASGEKITIPLANLEVLE